MRHLLLACLLCLAPTTTTPVRNINIHIAFGYKDARPARFVGDLFEKAYLVELLTRPCESKSNPNCGYLRDFDDGELLSRDIRGASGDVYRLNLRITASSAGPDDDENRLDPFQAARSAGSEKNFLSGVSGADLTFYVGHSRDGGGPDFRPPRLRANGHVDYAWYRHAKTGFAKLISALPKDRKNVPAQPPSLGLISCDSGKWFRKAIHKVSPRLNLITVDALIYYSDGINALLKNMADDLADRIPANSLDSPKPG